MVVKVLDDDTEETLAKRILEKEHQAYPEAVKLFAENKIKISGGKTKIS
jgi:phosphoribosylglycinamide formyltransferase-1